MSGSAVGGSAAARGVKPDPTRIVRMTRVLAAPVDRVYRAWADPQALSEWFPYRVEGSLAVGARSVLVWPERRVWWDVLEADPTSRFRFRWAWLPEDAIQTTVTVTLHPHGYGTRLTLEDGPFDVSTANGLDAYAESLEGWGEALAHLAAQVDHGVDLRQRPRTG